MAADQRVDIAEFQSWLAKGLGRAAVFLKAHDPALYLDTLLHSCTHLVGYDPQCEDSRVPYLWTLIALSKNSEFFRNAVYRHLKEALDGLGDLAWSQIFGLARLYAQNGDVEMRAIMYSLFDKHGFMGSDSLPDELTRLDGFEGFSLVADQLDLADDEAEVWMFFSVIYALEEKLGQEQAKRLIAEKASKDEKFSQLMRSVEEERKVRQREDRPATNYEALRSRPWDDFWNSDLSSWSERASPEELNVMAQDIRADMEQKKLEAMLRVFRRKPYTGDIGQLLALSNDTRRLVKHMSVRALSKVCHPSVRRRALELLQSLERPDDGAEMLLSNYEQGDFTLFEEALRRANDQDVIHGIGFATRKFMERNVASDAEATLLLLYQKGPCALCRTHMVQYLAVLKRLPDWMREECLYDSEERTAKIAQGDLGAVTD